MAKQRHYYLWKNHRISDQATLGTMRAILYDAGLLTLLKTGEWIIDRGWAEYQRHLGLTSGIHRVDAEKRFSGRINPFEPFRWADSGPGNGTALYEGVAPGVLGAGLGSELLFSVEGTLRHCMHPLIRSRADGISAPYEYQPLASVLSEMEIISVGELMSSLAGLDEPSLLDRITQILRDATADGEIPASAVVAAHKLATGYKGSARERSDPETTFKAIALSFLVDELVCRTRVPNSMNFSYQEAATVLSSFLAELKDLFPYFSQAEAEEVAREAPGIFAEATARLESEAEQISDPDWLSSTGHVADIIRSAAYRGRALRTLPEEPASLMFTTANALWRWIFFIDHRLRFRTGRVSDEEARTELVMHWLQRPWGIVRGDDLNLAFRGFVPDDDGEMPQLFYGLQEILPSEPEAYVVDVLHAASRERGIDALRRLVRRRIALDELRMAITSVRIDGELMAWAQRVHTIIDLFAVWWYACVKRGDAPDLASDIHQLSRLMREGAWINDAQAEVEDEVVLSAEQQDEIREYAANPRAFAEQSFVFDADEFDIRTQLDVFPPEEFVLLSYI